MSEQLELSTIGGDEDITGGGADGLPGMPKTEQTGSLMGSVAGVDPLAQTDEFGDDSARAGKRRISQGTLLLIVVFAVAAGGLYLMRVTHGDITAPATDATVEARIEQALMQHGNPDADAANDPLRPANVDALFADTDSIIAMFSSDLTRRQVPLEYLQKNPFNLPQAIVEPDPAAPDADADGAPAAALAPNHKRIEKLRQELDELALQTIMFGSNPMAMINGDMVTQGQQIGSFTVVQIKRRSIELRGEGTDFTLRMRR